MSPLRNHDNNADEKNPEKVLRRSRRQRQKRNGNNGIDDYQLEYPLGLIQAHVPTKKFAKARPTTPNQTLKILTDRRKTLIKEFHMIADPNLVGSFGSEKWIKMMLQNFKIMEGNRCSISEADLKFWLANSNCFKELENPRSLKSTEIAVSSKSLNLFPLTPITPVSNEMEDETENIMLELDRFPRNISQVYRDDHASPCTASSYEAFNSEPNQSQSIPAVEPHVLNNLKIEVNYWSEDDATFTATNSDNYMSSAKVKTEEILQSLDVSASSKMDFGKREENETGLSAFPIKIEPQSESNEADPLETSVENQPLQNFPNVSASSQTNFGKQEENKTGLAAFPIKIEPQSESESKESDTLETSLENQPLQNLSYASELSLAHFVKQEDDESELPTLPTDYQLGNQPLQLIAYQIVPVQILFSNPPPGQQLTLVSCSQGQNSEHSLEAQNQVGISSLNDATRKEIFQEPTSPSCTGVFRGKPGSPASPAPAGMSEEDQLILKFLLEEEVNLSPKLHLQKPTTREALQAYIQLLVPLVNDYLENNDDRKVDTTACVYAAKLLDMAVKGILKP